METPMFQQHKIQRAIQTQGSDFTVQSPGLNEFNEPTSWGYFKTIRGLYHEVTGYVTKTTDQGSSIKRKSSPMLLCLVEEIKGVQEGMRILIQEKPYTLVKIKDLSESGIVVDLSLEEIQDG